MGWRFFSLIETGKDVQGLDEADNKETVGAADDIFAISASDFIL